MKASKNSTPKPYDDEAKRKRAERWAKYSANNRDKLNAAQRARNAADPSCQRNANLKHLYGITLAEWNTLFYRQGCCCDICGVHDLDYTGRWHTDHSHTTGKVRGILCQHCNTLLGDAKDDPSTLSKAIGYLKTHNG